MYNRAQSLNINERKKLAKTAYLYYKENKTQLEIANMLDVDRSTVSRQLKEAREMGILRVEIDNFDTKILQMEEYIRNKYQIPRVEIIPSNLEDSEDRKDINLAEAAAFHIKNVIVKDLTVGVAWGKTLKNTIEQIEGNRNTNSTFIPIAGGPSTINSQYHVNTLVYELAKVFGGQSVFINATAVQEEIYLRNKILCSKYFNQILEHWHNLDLVLLGIGGLLSHKDSHWRDLLSQDDIENLKENHAVGDLCCQFFDERCKLINGDLSKRTIALSLSEIRKVPESIAIGRGKSKARTIIALLRK